MLNPRKRPKSPPREAMKSTGPILMLLSNSKGRQALFCFGNYKLHPWLFLRQRRCWQQQCLPPRRCRSSLGRKSVLMCPTFPMLRILPWSLRWAVRPCASVSWVQLVTRCTTDLNPEMPHRCPPPKRGIKTIRNQSFCNSCGGKTWFLTNLLLAPRV